MTVNEIARGPRTPSFIGTAMAAVVGNELWLARFSPIGWHIDGCHSRARDLAHRASCRFAWT
jgi:hypothetical protein